MTTQDPKPSQSYVALKDFSRYQINTEAQENSVHVAKKSFKSSVNELKIKRKVLFQDKEMSNLPGISQPLLPKENPSFTQIEKNIREEEKATNTIHLLGISEQIKYWSLLAVFTFCRGALCPLMASIPLPIVPKLVWRNLLLSAMLVPLVYSEVSSSDASLLKNYKDGNQLMNLLIASSAFTVWIFCSVYASHHNDISQIVALTSCQFLIIGLHRFIKGLVITETERRGILISLASVFILMFWNTPSHTPHTHLEHGVFSYWEVVLQGNLMAFGGGVASSIYLIYSRRLNTGNTIHFNNFNYTIFGLVVYIIVMLFFEGTIEGWEAIDSKTSFWSVFTWKLFFEMVLISLVTGFLPNAIYPSLSRVFDPMVLGLAFVIQPLAALIIALVLNLQTLPSIVVALGITLNIVGNFMVRKEVTAADSDTIAVDQDLISVENGVPIHTYGGAVKGKKPLDLDLILV